MKFKEITIQTTRLESQKDFYCNQLGLRVIEETNSTFAVEIGSSNLKFSYHKYSTPYHIAFNIPAKKEVFAWKWLSSKAEILKYNGDNIVDFPKWNAKALYFYDPDMNIVELISRNNLDNPNSNPFSERDLLSVSEIGIPTHNIAPVFNMLQTQLGIDIYDGDTSKFCAAGDETGMFIIIDKNKKKWFPLDDEAFSSDFEAVVELSPNVLKTVSFKTGILDVY